MSAYIELVRLELTRIGFIEEPPILP